MIIKVVFLAEKTAKNLHLDNQHYLIFYTMVSMPPTQTPCEIFGFDGFNSYPFLSYCLNDS